LFCAANCVPLLVQQNVDGSDFFNRPWKEFKVGFNDSRGNFWLGNDLLHQLTTSRRYRLRFDLQARDNGSWYYAEYSSFVVSSESLRYTITVSGYSGNAGDAFSYHDGNKFSTYDRDYDQLLGSCAGSRYGGFWYSKCALANVNTARGRADDFSWNGGATASLTLQSSRMWLMC